MASVHQVVDKVGDLSSSIKLEAFPLSEKAHPEMYADNEQLKAFKDAFKESGVCLKGHILAHDRRENTLPLTLQMQLNRDVNAFAHVTQIKSVEGLVGPRHTGIDFIVFRETTQGEYCALEHESVPGVVESLKITTEAGTERLARFAFEEAIKAGRKKVTCVHKANIMKKGDGLFMRVCDKVALDYQGKIEYETMIVDNTCMQLVSNPWQFDVIVTGNLYGNIIENLGAGMIGGSGLAPSAHHSNEGVMFGPGARAVARSMAGKNECNPTVMLLSFANLLAHKGHDESSERLRNAVLSTIKAGTVLTRDMNGNATTKEFTNAVINNM